MSLLLAQAAFREGRPLEGERICRAVLAQAPHYWHAYAVLADCLLAQGKEREADAFTADAHARNPGQPDLLVARGGVVARCGRIEEAIEFLDQAIEVRIDHSRGHEMLASLLEQRQDPSPRYEVSVITPSIGTDFLEQAIASVQKQNYPFVRHFIVADGPEGLDRIARMLPSDPRHPIHLVPLPINVGAGGFNGHRVYGAMPFLVPSRFVSFLDEDNWFADDHLETLMKAITGRGLAWAYSLRVIVSLEGEMITTDDCESLGKWPTWNNPLANLVDVNCYVLRRDVAISASPLWHRRFRDQESPDFLLCRKLLTEQHRFATNGRYTVNYRVGRSPRSVRAEFFLRGNGVMRQRYGAVYPWQIEGGILANEWWGL